MDAPFVKVQSLLTTYSNLSVIFDNYHKMAQD